MVLALIAGLVRLDDKPSIHGLVNAQVLVLLIGLLLFTIDRTHNNASEIILVGWDDSHKPLCIHQYPGTYHQVRVRM